MTGTVAGLAVTVVLAAVLLHGLSRARLAVRRASRVIEHPPPGPLSLPSGPAAGHHRRDGHMVIDCWPCGCLYTWTKPAGWVHDFDCLDQELEELLRDR